MHLRELMNLLGCRVIWGEELLSETEVQSCFAADLMSDVLAFSEPGALLVTGLASIQSVHTADVADLKAILFVGDKTPGQPVLDLALQRRIPLLATMHTMFDACAALQAAGLKASDRR